MSYFAKINKSTGRIIGHGKLDPENAARMPCAEDQMMIEVRESVDTTRHFFVDLVTHELLGEDRQPVVEVHSQPEVQPVVNSLVKLLPVREEDKS